MSADFLISVSVIIVSLFLAVFFHGWKLTIAGLCVMAALAGAFYVGWLWVLIGGGMCVAGICNDKTYDKSVTFLGYLFGGLIVVAVLGVIFGWHRYIDNVFLGGLYKVFSLLFS